MSSSSATSFTSILSISNQYRFLETIQKDLLGLYVLPREDDIFTWDGVIFVSSGVWEEGIFKFTLSASKPLGLITITISRDIGATIPSLKFVTPLFHPFVNPRVFFFVMV